MFFLPIHHPVLLWCSLPGQGDEHPTERDSKSGSSWLQVLLLCCLIFKDLYLCVLWGGIFLVLSQVPDKVKQLAVIFQDG